MDKHQIVLLCWAFEGLEHSAFDVPCPFCLVLVRSAWPGSHAVGTQRGREGGWTQGELEHPIAVLAGPTGACIIAHWVCQPPFANSRSAWLGLAVMR